MIETSRRLPSAHPDGWFRVAFADELEPAEVRPLRYFGRELVLASTASGVAQVFDAFCPHLGAHLGHGGRIEGESLRCPFHGWCFEMSGECVEVSYAKRIPRGARLRAWPTVVRNGIVWVWHHAQAEAPSWEVPSVEEVDDPDWSALVHHRWKIRTRNQEIAENTSDPAHFKTVHGFAETPSPRIDFDGVRYTSVSEFEAPRSDGSLVASILSVSWHGLGIGVTHSSGALDLLFIGSTTPIDDEWVEACFSFSVCEARGLRPDVGGGKAFIAESIRQMEQDIPIWENKIYREAPNLCDGDGPIPEFRRWARQFYSARTA